MRRDEITEERGWEERGWEGMHCQPCFNVTSGEMEAWYRAHNVSAAQVALKWIVQQSRPVACASWREDYMLEDLDLWSWGDLTAAEMQELTAGGSGPGGAPRDDALPRAAQHRAICPLLHVVLRWAAGHLVGPPRPRRPSRSCAPRTCRGGYGVCGVGCGA